MPRNESKNKISFVNFWDFPLYVHLYYRIWQSDWIPPTSDFPTALIIDLDMYGQSSGLTNYKIKLHANLLLFQISSGKYKLGLVYLTP